MSLKKILSLKSRCFLHGSDHTSVSLTPVSHLMIQNMANNWIKRNLELPSVEFFVHPTITYSEPMTRTNFHAVKPIVDNYMEFYRQWTDSPLVGVIKKFTFLRDNKTISHINSKKYDALVLALFCSQDQSHIWNQKLHTHHEYWFRNLTNSPLVSGFVTKSDEKTNKKWSIDYKIDETDHQLETIDYLKKSSNQLLDAIDSDLILCQIDLENTYLSLLCEAFCEIKPKTETKKAIKMKINKWLAPFKVGFTVRENVELTEELILMTKYMVEALRQFEISVFPFTANKLMSIERSVIDNYRTECLKFAKSFDELGVPFTVIVDGESLQTGMVSVRNRDNGLEHSLHISDFQKSLCLTLDVIHPSTIRTRRQTAKR